MIPAAFDWDAGNWPKCGQHGVSKEEIEFIFRNVPMTSLDPHFREQRFRAAGPNADGRYVFVVFTVRQFNGIDLVRPISARYMHEREIRLWRKEN